jgi:hypothetical protein
MLFIGVVRMQLGQLAGEMGSARVSRAACGITPHALSESELKQVERGSRRDAANSTPEARAPQHNIQHVQCPAALGDGNILQWFDALELFPHFFQRGNDRGSRRESALITPAFLRRKWSRLIPLCGTATSDDNGNARLDRNAIQLGDLPRFRFSGCCSQSSRRDARCMRGACV